MRNFLALMAASTMLAACGGGTGPTFAGSAAPPATGGGTGGGSGGGTGGGNTGSSHSFVNPTEVRTYQGIGGAQTYSYLNEILVDPTTGSFIGNATSHQAQTYAGNASSARNSNISITYDPRAGVYTLSIADPASGTNVSTNFQDPASRTDFGGNVEPQWGTPNTGFQNVSIFEAGDGDPISPYRRSGDGRVELGRNDLPPLGEDGSSYQSATIFLQNPGSGTDYVTFAGFVRNEFNYLEIEDDNNGVITTTYRVEHDISRGAFVFGERTLNQDVPTTGLFDFSGNMLATMINNPTIDGQNGSSLDSFYQWIEGSVNLTVDFANDEVRDILLNGIVSNPQIDALTQNSGNYDPNGVYSYLPGGTAFEASGSATIDLVGAGGFLGAIDTARFIARGGNLFADGSSVQNILIEGSSIDGAFFGPNGDEVGGGFRIVGGIPDERIDIMGVFTAGRN